MSRLPWAEPALQHVFQHVSGRFMKLQRPFLRRKVPWKTVISATTLASLQNGSLQHLIKLQNVCCKIVLQLAAASSCSPVGSMMLQQRLQHGVDEAANGEAAKPSQPASNQERATRVRGIGFAALESIGVVGGYADTKTVLRRPSGGCKRAAGALMMGWDV